MLKVVENVQPKEIKVDDIVNDTNNIFAYRCKNSDAYCVLTKFTGPDDGKRYFGFFPLNTSDSMPRFVAQTQIASIKEAMRLSRTVYKFTSMREMLTAMLDRRF